MVRMSKKIFIIDDHKDIAEVSKNVLEREGYQVYTFTSGEDAFLAFKKNKPNLILLDHLLPGKCGAEICHEVKSDEKLKDISVILVTGQVLLKEPTGGDPNFIKPDDYLIKPFDIDDLLIKVKSSL